MHHVLRGAFGAAVVYPLVWYYYSGPGAAQPVATGAARPSGQQQVQGSSPEPVFAEPAQPGVFDPGGSEGEPRVSRSASKHLPSTAPQFRLPIEPELPRDPNVEEPTVDAPNVPLPAFAELQEVLGQMKELQQHAHDPAALEKRVQQIEEDPQKVAKLRAIADMFVKMPASRGESYLPTGATAPSTPSR
ncbi:MAG: hypothetical protein RL685_1658 [Pseudomonadota bacterium]|jgi:hypothetical protein